MDSDGDDPKGPGFPIRISTDQSLFAAPHGFSQRTTSFIASRCQGIHQTPLRRLIDPTSNGQRPIVSSTTGRSPEDGTSSALYYPVSTTERSNSPSKTPLAGIPSGPGSPGHHALHHVQQPATGTEPRAKPTPRIPRQGDARQGISAFRDRAGVPCGPPGNRKMVGQGRLELPTSRLSSARSNQLSY